MVIVCKKVVKVNVFPKLIAKVHKPQSSPFVDELAHFPRLSVHPLSAAVCHVVPDNCVVNKEFHSLTIQPGFSAAASDQKAYNTCINHEVRGGQ